MCNFYIMYYTENDGRSLYSNDCWQSAPRNLVYPRLPSLTTPPATPTTTPTVSITTTDGGSNDHEHDDEDNYECPKPLPPGSGNSRCVNTTTTTPIPVPPTPIQTPKTGSKTPVTVQTPMSSTHGDTPTNPSPHSRFFEGDSDIEFESVGLVPAENWPLNGVDIPGVTLGQVSAVAVDKDGSVHILHRGPVVWNYR